MWLYLCGNFSAYPLTYSEAESGIIPLPINKEKSDRPLRCISLVCRSLLTRKGYSIFYKTRKGYSSSICNNECFILYNLLYVCCLLMSRFFSILCQDFFVYKLIIFLSISLNCSPVTAILPSFKVLGFIILNFEIARICIGIA